MPIRRVNIPRIDCGDKSGCLSEFVSIIAFIMFYVVFAGVIILIIAGIGCGLANLLG